MLKIINNKKPNINNIPVYRQKDLQKIGVMNFDWEKSDVSSLTVQINTKIMSLTSHALRDFPAGGHV